MRKISQRTRQVLEAEPDVCLRYDEGNCAGRITYEHALKHAGRQIDAPWAILKICEYHHAVNQYQDIGDLNKEKHRWLALNRATDEELEAISKAVDYKAERDRLNKIYG